MKQITTIFLILFVVGCATDSSTKNSGTDTNSGNSTESLSPQVISPPGTQPVITPSNQAPVINPNQTTAGADADGKVWHFVCADGCAGGVGDAKANCPVCGKEMAHNQAYHTNSGTPNQPPVINPGANSPVINPGANSPIINPQAAEPPQNAKGVWHYTCAKGCAGGGGAAGPCAVCGGPLAHNAVYHQ